MRLGVISDVHGNAPALRAALDALRGRCDGVVFLGDLAGYYPFVNAAADLLAAAPLCGAVLGNHDAVLRGCIETGMPPDAAYTRKYGTALDRAWRDLSPLAERLLLSWQPSMQLTFDGARVMLAHGAPWDPLEGRVYPDSSEWARFDDYDAEIFLLGHTHYQVERHVGSRLIVNPGSVGQPRDRSEGAAFAICDIAARRVDACRVPYDKQSLLADARQHDPDMPYLSEVLTR